MKSLSPEKKMATAKFAARQLARITGHLVGTRVQVTTRDTTGELNWFYPLVDRLGRRVAP